MNEAKVALVKLMWELKHKKNGLGQTDGFQLTTWPNFHVTHVTHSGKAGIVVLVAALTTERQCYEICRILPQKCDHESHSMLHQLFVNLFFNEKLTP